MHAMDRKILFLFLIYSVVKPIRALNTTVWSYHLWLDPHQKFSVKWNIDAKDETITFLCEVQTKGWIGLGLSPNGGMKGSDIVIAWVDDNNGLAHFTVFRLLFH